MRRFFFPIFDSLGFIPDDEGRELPSAEHARHHAIEGARSLLGAEILTGKLDLRGRIEVTDDRGNVIEIVPFEGVLDILRGAFPSNGESGS